MGSEPAVKRKMTVKTFLDLTLFLLIYTVILTALFLVVWFVLTMITRTRHRHGWAAYSKRGRWPHSE